MTFFEQVFIAAVNGQMASGERNVDVIVGTALKVAKAAQAKQATQGAAK